MQRAGKTSVLLLFFCPLLFCLFSFSVHAAEKPLPFREDAGLTKAEYLLSVGQYSAALETANAVLVRHPESADAYTYQAYAYHSLGEMASAKKSLEKALLLNPKHLGANKYLGDMYLEAGDVSRALEQLQVIRMTCGQADCAELTALESEIDDYKKGGGTPEKN